MSGIAGIFHLQTAKPVDADRVRAMADAMRHRGPDGTGVWTARGVGLSHRRLAIMDADELVQPLVDPAGRLSVVCDGELLDTAPLRAELEQAGQGFVGGGTAELILGAWRHWGEACLSRLHGPFAFALHDAERHRLFLVRDRLGAKPLHYAILADGSLAFASELKGLLAHPGVRRRPDPRAVEDFLALGYIPDDACLVDGVAKLPAGHQLLVTRGRPVPDPRRWWHLDFTHRAEAGAAALQAELTNRLQASVRGHMLSDRPVGALVDGDGDNAMLVALMAEASPRAVLTAAGGSPVQNEAGRMIDQIVRRFATEHGAGDGSITPVAVLDALTTAFDEPFADPAAPGALLRAGAARGRMAVALAADGTDLVMPGDGRHRAHVTLARLRAVLPATWRSWAGEVGGGGSRLSGLARRAGAGEALRTVAIDPAARYAASVGITASEARDGLYTEGMAAALHGYRAERRFEDAMRAAPAREALDRVQHADLMIALPGALLTRLDRTGMAAGLELRAPFLDPALVMFAARLPAAMRTQGNLRRALRRQVPREMLGRPVSNADAQISAWCRSDLANLVAALPRDSALAATGWFRRTEIARLGEDHRAGRADHGLLLWQLLLLDRSIRKLFGVGA